MHPRAVILRHTLPDGSTHLDLLLERQPASPQLESNPDDRRLIAFRLPDPLPDGQHVVLDADRLPDHRAHYLDHEGPIDAQRGRVARLLTAHLSDLNETPSQVTATLKTEPEAIRIRAKLVRASQWRLTIERHPAANR